MLLKGLLVEEGVFPIDKDRATSGVLAGFYGGDVVQIFVKDEDFTKASEILQDFQENTTQH